MHKRKQTSVKRQPFSSQSDWKIGREPMHFELRADLWETLTRNAALLGMDTEEYASYTLSIQVVRVGLKQTLNAQAIAAIEETFGLLFHGMPQRRGGLERLDRMLSTALEYVEDNPQASILDLLCAMDASALN